MTQLPANIQQAIERLQDSSIITAMEDTLLVICALLFIMFLLATFIPKKEREIPLAERVPDVSEAV